MTSDAGRVFSLKNAVRNVREKKNVKTLGRSPFVYENTSGKAILGGFE